MGLETHRRTWMTWGQLPLLLLLVCACLGMDHGCLRLTRTTALVAIVLGALLKLSPLVTRSLASNLWRVQQNQNPGPDPSQPVVLGLRQSHWWTLQMQLSSHVSRSA